MSNNNHKETLINELKSWLDYLGYKGYDEVDEDDLDCVLDSKFLNPDVKDWVDNMPRKEFKKLFCEIQNRMSDDWAVL